MSLNICISPIIYPLGTAISVWTNIMLQGNIATFLLLTLNKILKYISMTWNSIHTNLFCHRLQHMSCYFFKGNPVLPWNTMIKNDPNVSALSRKKYFRNEMMYVWSNKRLFEDQNKKTIELVQYINENCSNFDTVGPLHPYKIPPNCQTDNLYILVYFLFLTSRICIYLNMLTL